MKYKNREPYNFFNVKLNFLNSIFYIYKQKIQKFSLKKDFLKNLGEIRESPLKKNYNYCDLLP